MEIIELPGCPENHRANRERKSPSDPSIGGWGVKDGKKGQRRQDKHSADEPRWIKEQSVESYALDGRRRDNNVANSSIHDVVEEAAGNH